MYRLDYRPRRELSTSQRIVLLLRGSVRIVVSLVLATWLGAAVFLGSVIAIAVFVRFLVFSADLSG